jgi:hypothetical protein
VTNGRVLTVEISFGRQFYISAFEPIQKYCDLMARKDIVAALAVVQHHHLTESFYRGVDAVAREAKTSRDAVLQVLPTAEAYAAAEASAQSQQRAVEVFNQHEGDLGHLIVGSAGLFVDTYVLGGFGLGNLLASKAGDFLRNTRLEGPCKDLDAALKAYDAVLKRCVSFLDANTSFGTAVGGSRRTQLWAVLAVAMGAGAAVATALWLRSSAATTSPSVAPAAASVSIIASEPTPAAPPLPAPLPAPVASPAAVAKPRPTARPATSAPVSRAACLQACVAKCNDDASCERSCAATCPH